MDKIKGLPKPFLIALGIGVAVILIGLAVFLLAPESKTQVVLHNTGDCPKITLELVSEDGEERLSVEAKAGESARLDVTPNRIYIGRLISDNTSSGGAGCLFSDVEGEENIDYLERVIVPDGSVLDINVPSVNKTTPTS